MLRLNLGSCDRHFSGFTNVDLVQPADVIADLAQPWPWPDSSVTEIRAWDILEHIGDCQHIDPAYCCGRCAAVRVTNTQPQPGVWIFGPAPTKSLGDIPQREFRGIVHVMNEAWRVLEPGGRFDIIVPTTDGRGAWQDPTHVTFWNRNSFYYFTAGDAHLTRFAPANGVRCAFQVLAESEPPAGADRVTKLHIVLEAVK